MKGVTETASFHTIIFIQGGVRVSLADFNPMLPCRLRWYNILNLKFLQAETQRCNSSLSNTSTENGNTSSSSSGVVAPADIAHGSVEMGRIRRASTGDRNTEVATHAMAAEHNNIRWVEYPCFVLHRVLRWHQCLCTSPVSLWCLFNVYDRGSQVYFLASHEDPKRALRQVSGVQINTTPPHVCIFWNWVRANDEGLAGWIGLCTIIWEPLIYIYKHTIMVNNKRKCCVM